MNDKCNDWSCPNITYLGYCKVTACSKNIQYGSYGSSTSKPIYFPVTVGNITFYNQQQLIKWIEDKQKMRENEDYGNGVYS